MRYMGSKSRFASQLLPILLSDRSPEQPFVEPFCGGCNVTSRVPGPRVAADSNGYLIAMWQELQRGWTPPIFDAATYRSVKVSPKSYPPHIVGWCGFQCSYSGKWFGGFAGRVLTRGGWRDYQDEATRNVVKQLPLLADVEFRSCSYDELDIPDGGIVYCDPPYADSTGYAGDFDSGRFWEWARDLSSRHTVYVSEYTAPEDFECLWSCETGSSLSANGKSGGRKQSVERLFKLRR